MAKQTINLGSAPDDGTGDTLRVGGDKINDNFDELYGITDGLGTASTLDVDTDDTLAANSDTVVPSQQAVKAYVDNEIAGLPGGVSALDDLSDVDLTGASTGDVLTKDAGGDWVAAAPTGGGGSGDMLAANNLSDVSSKVAAKDNISVKGSDIASASTTDLSGATGDFVTITGTTTITAFGTCAAGVERTLHFSGALTLTHNATSLILPTGANIRTASGDTMRLRSLGSGNWRCVGYMRASGQAIDALTPPISTDFATTVNSPTATDGPKSCKVTGAASTTRVRALLRSLPGTDFTVVMKMKAHLQADFNGVGIIFRDTAGKYLNVGLVHNSTNNVAVMDQFSNSTTIAGSAGTTSFDESDPAPEWLKISFNNTTKAITGYWSYSGDNWETIATSTYLGTPDAVGFGLVCNNATIPIQMFIEHWSLV